MRKDRHTTLEHVAVILVVQVLAPTLLGEALEVLFV